jgi:hypothetical protein
MKILTAAMLVEIASKKRSEQSQQSRQSQPQHPATANTLAFATAGSR